MSQANRFINFSVSELRKRREEVEQAINELLFEKWSSDEQGYYERVRSELESELEEVSQELQKREELARSDTELSNEYAHISTRELKQRLQDIADERSSMLEFNRDEDDQEYYEQLGDRYVEMYKELLRREKLGIAEDEDEDEEYNWRDEIY